ncbi:uncharacterized protein PITG_10064 [Phytophthora infestans T30-4]|uniref:Carbohydrate-binding protein n=1 Tax=Phytophthora infestans (strain T30-4) TaxID=403677 RepID=D0NE81_PHYIT|nr:uncharacterized protein PITG_10064 [Phytophthora infestans T30-4]EEY56526.1 conserved hypothetical protein [Phytophthora infestans T30-4]|eukprot:XP_002902600.1 conserved hypothetical protein [Phytophthora infestans T30-4]
MWPKLAVAGALLLIQGANANDCAFTVSVLDIPGVQCVQSAPCSGTYYASGLSQGVGACPSGTNCALLPETPIMGCAAAGRTDLIYVNADGSLTKDGRSVTLSGASSDTADSTTTAPTTSNTDSTASSNSKSTSSSSTANSSNGSNASSSTANSSNGSNGSQGSNANSGSAGSSTTSGSDGSDATADSSNSTSTSASSAANSSSSASGSWRSDSGSGSVVISPGSSSANQQSFNPGSILSDSSNKSKSGGDGGLGIGSIIAIVVGCLAVVAIAAGARLLRKGKEAEMATPEAPGAMEGYNNGGGGGGGGMTPKENVLLL